jgi:alpha-D-glucose phosphate-specific phosphoglucomutase
VIPEIKFGTDGWRALIARDFTFENTRIVAQGIAGYIKSQNLLKKGVVIGYDSRFLSQEFARECAQVLVGNGIKVFMSNRVTPTPVTAFAVRVTDAAGAIMITASHNPPQYNGIKFIPEYAGPAMPDVTFFIENEIKRVAESGKVYQLSLHEAEQLGLVTEIDIDKEYISHILSMVNQDVIRGKKLKVVVNPMFGAGIGYLDKILSGLECEVKTINNYRDTLFGGLLPEPTRNNLSDLQWAVTNYNADVGLAMDGDADRFGIVNHQGQFVTPNHIMCLLLDHLLKTRSFRGPVSRSAATTHLLDRVARKNGLGVIEKPVGFKYIGQAMREKGCILGGEESGGLSIFGHIPEKDGILAGLLTVEMLAYANKNLDEIIESFTREYGWMVSERFDVSISPADKPLLLEQIDQYKPQTIAGIRVVSRNTENNSVELEDGSWVLIRPSGTEPIIRIYIEANHQSQLEDMHKEIIEKLNL